VLGARLENQLRMPMAAAFSLAARGCFARR